MIPARIFLIGYRGTGKSTVARLLAERLGRQWLDADAVLEAEAGCTIRDLFAREGEPGFRRRESALLERLCGLTDHILATGGGVILDPVNRARLRESGCVVWLTADAETLEHRISGDVTTAQRRPNLTIGGLQEIRDLLSLREPLYRACADVVVDTVGRTPEQIVDAVVPLLSRERPIPQ